LLRLAIWLAVFAALFSSPAVAEPTAFSKQVTALTGDWEAEEMKEGRIKLHPEKYTWQSDNYFTIAIEEPRMGRDPKQVYLNAHGETITPNKKSFYPREAKESSAGVWALFGDWTDTYGDANLSIWGIIKTDADTLIRFEANCQPDKGDPGEFDACTKTAAKLMGLLRDRQLIMPEPRDPLVISGWKSSYATNGVSTLTSSNYNNTVTAIIQVSPPMMIPADKLQPVIAEFSKGLWDNLVTGAAKTPSSQSWVGTTTNPWIRATFPNSIQEDNASTIMAGSEKLADGRTVLIAVACPYIGWQETCAYGVERSQFWIKTGIMEKRAKKIVDAHNVPLPANGMKNSDVLGIYTESNYDAMSATFSMDGNYYFKDGRAYKRTKYAPWQIDPIASKQEDPNDWGRWTRKGDKVQIVWGDGDTDDVSATSSNLLVGGPKNMRLSGYYGSIYSSGNLITGSGFVQRSGYTFYPDGTFKSSTSSMFSVGGFVGEGAGGASPSTLASGGGGSTSGRARYEIDGFGITFYYPDGRITRMGFAIYARDVDNPKRETIYIGGSAETLNGGEG
jgi:hypothetical protein